MIPSVASDTFTLVHSGCTYTIGKVPAGVGLRAAALIASMIAPALKGGGSRDAVAALLASDKLGDNLEALCSAFAPCTQVQMAKGSATLGDCFDVHFAGNYGALIAWLTAAVEFNLSSFFAALPDLAAKAGLSKASG